MRFDGNGNPFDREDIAIVGMSCLFPGAATPARFWQNIIGKVDCIGDAPANWQPELFYDPHDPYTDRAYTKRGGFLGDLCRFDPIKYGVVPTSVEGSEPDHFIALRCAHEALADAGVPEIPINREKTAVILGRGLFANRGWLTVFQQLFAVDQVIKVLERLNPDLDAQALAAIKAELKRNLPPTNAETFPGLVHSALVGRIANRMNLNGPTYTLDAACSAALLAVDQAMHELRSGRCDAVLVGGAQVSTPPQIQILFCKLQALSKSGRIAPFSADANGTLLGQGCGMLVLKRRSDAQRDGNRIYALLKAIGSSSDGKGAGLLAPRTEGQQLAIRRAYEQSGISPDTIGLLEAHGTGIAMGDAVELNSIRCCFPSAVDPASRIALGSVKSMIGHLIPAAGIASLIKTTLALYHRVLPPTLHAEKPAAALDGSRFFLCQRPLPWVHGEADRPRRAGINAFGFGGINTHAIVEEYTGADETTQESFEKDWPCELVVLSAADRESLRARAAALAEWLKEADGVTLLEVAASAAREQGTTRLAIVARSLDDLQKKLWHAEKLLGDASRTRIQDRKGIFWYDQPLGREGGIAFVFPGEGSQYVHMHVELCRHFPEVRRQLELTERAMRRRGDGSFCQLLYPQPQDTAEAERSLFQMEVAVAAVTASARGLLDLLKRLEVVPGAVVGHSSGEFAAVLAAGAFAPADQEALVQSIIDGTTCTARVARSEAVPPAVLTAVGGVDPAIVAAIVDRSRGRLVIAMDNCPHQVILVGDEEATAEALGHLAGKGGICQRLPWDRPYHTAAAAPICHYVAEYLAGLEFVPATTPMWSCAMAAPIAPDPESIRELLARQWQMPVRFRETILAMHNAGLRIFVEVGPRGNLSAFINDTLDGLPHAAIPLDAQRKGDIEQLCHAVGMLVAHGVDARWQVLYERRRPRILDLQGDPVRALPPDPILKLELPTLELSDEFVAEITSARRRPQVVASRSAKPAADGTRPPVVQSPADPGRTAATETMTGGVPLRTPAVPEAASRPVVPTTGRETAAWRRANAMGEFQQTMQMFLRTQQDCMRALGGSSKGAVRPVKTLPAVVRAQPSAPENGKSPSNRAHAELHGADQSAANGPAMTAASAPPPRQPRQWRYVQTVLEHRPGELLVCECELDIRRDVFLKDHTFFSRGLSLKDPQLTALPIMPMAMTSEFMAEAAAALFPDRHVVALSDISAARWLTFERETRRVRIAARTIAPDRVRATVYEADQDGTHAEIAAGTVELGSAAYALGPPRLVDRSDRPTPWQPEALYGKLLYHGACFQGIDRVERWGMRGIRALVHEPDPRAMFVDPDAGLPLLPVTLTDTASQIPGLRNGNFDERGSIVQMAFPNHIERLEFAAQRTPGEPLTAVATFEQHGAKLRSDVEVVGSGGRVVLRYLGKTEEIVDFPLRLYRYGSSPRDVRCSRDITHLFEGVGGIESCRICETNIGQEKLFVKQFWAQVLARMILSRRERDAFMKLRLPPIPTVEWLLGRVAAKDAVRLQAGLACCMADVEIDNDELGCPRTTGGEGLAPRLSIAHKHFYAVAAAADAIRIAGIGLDVEVLQPLEKQLIDDAFSASERALIAGSEALSGLTGEQAMRVAWAAKEAVGKALGRGLQGGPGSVRVARAAEGTFAAELASVMAARFPSCRTPLEVHWRLHGDRVITLCLLHASSTETGAARA
jgi:acyl transferase domain-containing protein/phosphopantetheinyl transferase